MTKSFLAVATLAAVPFATQAVVFNTVPTATGNATLSSQTSAGHVFTVGGGLINISSVGVFDNNDNSLAGNATVQLVLAGPGGPSNPVPGSSTVGTYTVLPAASSGHYVYVTTGVGGVTLSANRTYMIVVTAMSNSDLIGLNSPPAFNSDLPTFSSSLLTYQGDIANGAVGIGSRYKVANFVYAVPEPETYAMVAGVGLVAFGLWRRRQ